MNANASHARLVGADDRSMRIRRGDELDLHEDLQIY